MAVVVSIGRNVGGSPMDARTWRRFRDDVTRAVGMFGETVFRGNGVGEYDGHSEESFTVIVAAYDENEARTTLPHILRPLAHAYRQDAIALIVGATEFVG